MDGDLRGALEEILDDLRSEEAEQEAERGYASTHVSRAAARLVLLLDDTDGDVAPVTAIGGSPAAG